MQHQRHNFSTRFFSFKKTLKTLLLIETEFLQLFNQIQNQEKVKVFFYSREPRCFSHLFSLFFR